MLRIFNQYLSTRTIILVVSENLLILGTIQLVSMLKLSEADYIVLRDQGVFLRAVLITLICQLCFYFQDLYDFKIVKNTRELVVRLLRALGFCAILVAALYLFFPGAFLGEGVFLLTIFLLLGFFLTWRIGVFWLGQKRGLRHRTLVLGTGEVAKKLVAEILDRPDVGMRIVGFVSEDPKMVGESLVNPSVIGHIWDLAEIVKRERVERIVVAMHEGRGKMPVVDLLNLKMRGISIEEATTLYEKITGKIAVENLRPSWLIFSEGFKKPKLSHFYKRLFGIILSIIGLIFFFPVMIILAILVKLDSKGPVLFRQDRVGENGRIFQLLKFRSMFEDAETNTGPIWAKENDTRITRVGRFIRKVRLDELPQFINVLRGDMSFVGPRPERRHFVQQLSEKIPFYNLRHTVKPGITGWAQINCQYGGSLDGTLEKLQYDLYYIKHLSIPLDFMIIFQTIKIVLQGRGAY